MSELRLEVREFESLARWRWVLTGPGGEFLADHEVRLDVGCWQFEAFTGLLQYLRWHALPDRRLDDEARIVSEVGAWIGADVFGPVAGALVKKRPAAVRVVVPAEARSLLFRPLELGHAGGKPLAVQDVTFIMQLGIGDGTTGGATAIGDRLRVLGLFSLPAGGQPLNLRRERYAIVRLLRGIGAVGRAVDVRVLQYGVTRAKLQDVLLEAEGWDVIHISGHGAPGELLLETEDGSPEPIAAAELADLLELAADRLKLVTVSACWSAALTATEQRRLLGLPALGDPGQDEPAGEQPAEPGQAGERTGAGGAVVPGRAGARAEVGSWQGQGAPAGALAEELAGRLGCAVLAMRFPVVDDFAIGLADRLYDLLARQGQPLPRALGMALRQVVATPPTPECPALSAGTPALFGARAAGLTLAAPPRTQPLSYDTSQLKMANFLPEPDRFVDRTVTMAQASAALAIQSGRSGVLLQGMPGAGKTACALELAYTHEHAFETLVWYKAPDEGRDIRSALAQFAVVLETALPGFRILHGLEDPPRLAALLPQVTELLETRRVLVVADNIESLLTESGQWRDARWGQVIAAMCGHDGLGRMVLTSRRQPAGLDGRVQVQTVDALSLDEALLLARELPHLRALIEGRLPGLDAAEARRLAVGVLNTAQGHPKLLELANGQAANPTSLAVLVKAGDQAWQQAGGLPEGFFTTGEPSAAGQDYLHVLAAWTNTITDVLAPGERDLFWFLCCLEESDRVRPVADGNWADLWARLNRPGTPPDLDQGLAALAAHGLAASHPETDGDFESYGIHPGVAAAARSHAGPGFQQPVDTELAAYWGGLARYALEHESEEQTSSLLVTAGLSAAPYLLRLSEWATAAALLEMVTLRDTSLATSSAILPSLNTIAAGVAGTDDEPLVAALMARVLRAVDPAAAERQMRAVLDAALSRGDYAAASAAASEVLNHLVTAGRLAEALTLAEEVASYTRQAGSGPWTQLGDQVQRLQILAAMGQSQQVLDEVHRLRAHMDTLPTDSKRLEAVEQWNVRETLLDTGHTAALQLSRWQDALDLNAEIAESQMARGAPTDRIARTLFNDSGPLLRLGRLDDALALLLNCRQAFQDAGAVDALAAVLTALADLEDKRGHGQAAVNMEQDALRYHYRTQNADSIQISHHNLGNYLRRNARQPGPALAHHLTAALLCTIIGGGGLEQSVRAAVNDFRQLGADVAMPADVAALCAQVAEVPGVDLAQLLTALTTPETTEQAYQELLTRVRTAAATPARSARYQASWDPVIAALLAARAGDAQAATGLTEELAHYSNSSDWADLAAALTRIQGGDTSPDLMEGLDEIDTAIIARALLALAGDIAIPPALWPAIPLRQVIGRVVAAAEGDSVASADAGQVLTSMAEDSDFEQLAIALRRILGGERDPALGANLDDPTDRAIVDTVLHHITKQAEDT